MTQRGFFSFLLWLAFLAGGLFATQTPHAQWSSYRTWNKMPCSFEGAELGASGYPRRSHDLSYAKLVNRCAKDGYSKEPIFYMKDGTSINAFYGRPVVAIADMEFLYARDFGAQYRCHKDPRKSSKGYTHTVEDPWAAGEMRRCQKNYDGIEIIFRLSGKNQMVKYYHLKSTPIVPGFGQGNCALPLMKDRVQQHTRYPEDCGGVAVKFVKKGEIIGYVGFAGGAHVSFNVFDEGRWMIAPEDHTSWENKPKSSDHFLLPFQKNPPLPANQISGKILYDDWLDRVKPRLITGLQQGIFLEKCLRQHLGMQLKTFSPWPPVGERLKLVLWRVVESGCYFKVEDDLFNEPANILEIREPKSPIQPMKVNSPPCLTESALQWKSKTGESASLTIENKSASNVVLWRIADDATREQRGSLPSGDSILLETNVNRPWVLSNGEGECQAIVIPKEDAVFEWAGKP